MPIRRYKDKTGLVAQTTLRSIRAPHYVQAYVWATQGAMHANAGMDGDCIGCFLPLPRTWTFEGDDSEGVRSMTPKIGELHFVADDWNEEIVAHELMHAILHRIRTFGPTADDVMHQEDTGMQRWADGSAEEEVCYEFGRWFDRLWRWLWQVSPHGIHASPEASGE